MTTEKDPKTGKWLIQYRYKDWTGKLVNQFHSDVISSHCMEVETQFQYGFALGMLLMKDVYELPFPDKRTR